MIIKQGILATTVYLLLTQKNTWKNLKAREEKNWKEHMRLKQNRGV